MVGQIEINESFTQQLLHLKEKVGGGSWRKRWGNRINYHQTQIYGTRKRKNQQGVGAMEIKIRNPWKIEKLKSFRSWRRKECSHESFSGIQEHF